MDGFERRKEQKKESIRRAALELFNVYGFKKVSVNDIARKADVSQVTIYNHFGSKEGLVREVVKTLLLNMLERYRAVIEGERPFLEKLECIILDKAEMARQYQGEFVQTVLSNEPEIQQFVESMYQQEVNQLLIDFFEEGKRQRYINPALSQEAILVYTEIFRKGLMVTSALSADPEYNVKLLRELMSLYLYGLMGKRE